MFPFNGLDEGGEMNALYLILEIFVLCVLISASAFFGVFIAIENIPMRLDFEITDGMFLEEAAKRFEEQHDFDYDLYDCKNFSSDFKEVMGELGYDLEIIHGFDVNMTKGHAWTMAVISSQGQPHTDWRDLYPANRVLKGDK